MRPETASARAAEWRALAERMRERNDETVHFLGWVTLYAIGAVSLVLVIVGERRGWWGVAVVSLYALLVAAPRFCEWRARHVEDERHG